MPCSRYWMENPKFDPVKPFAESGPGRIVRVKALKYGNIPHYEWETTLIGYTEEYILLKGEAGRKLIHHGRGKVFECEHPSIEFFPFSEWFTVSVEKTWDGLNYYCNISMPPCYEYGTITFVDLDIDFVKHPEGEWCVADEDEFEKNSLAYCYPRELIDRAADEVMLMKRRIGSSQPPFNGRLEELVLRYL